MKKFISFFILAMLLTIGFQNCGKSSSTAPSYQLQSETSVKNVGAYYYNIGTSPFEYQYSINIQNKVIERITQDLNNSQENDVETCPVTDAATWAQLLVQVASAQVCHYVLVGDVSSLPVCMMTESVCTLGPIGINYAAVTVNNIGGGCMGQIPTTAPGIPLCVQSASTVDTLCSGNFDQIQTLVRILVNEFTVTSSCIATIIPH